MNLLRSLLGLFDLRYKSPYPWQRECRYFPLTKSLTTIYVLKVDGLVFMYYARGSFLYMYVERENGAPVIVEQPIWSYPYIDDDRAQSRADALVAKVLEAGLGESNHGARDSNEVGSVDVVSGAG